MMSLVFVGDRCADHSPSSGYDQLCTLFPRAGWLSGRSLAVGELSWIRPPAERLDLSQTVFHVLYGDCSGRALPSVLRERWPQATIVSTVHQPVSRLVGDQAALASMTLVDEIITVCQAQARGIASLGLSAPVRVIPHGVWTAAFHAAPDEEPPERDTALLVGTYLRDWRVANQVIGRLARCGVQSVVVGPNAGAHITIEHPLVRLLPRLPEGELGRRYHTSAALLLPVVDATASNALLEAMAAGCPVVCSRVSSLVDEYLEDESDSFEPGNPDAAVDRILRYITDPSRRRTRAHALASRAEHFDWARLRRRYSLCYEQIRSGAANRAAASTAD
jgi:glycosyltransferase involved in cell wall biosynthesis